MIYTYTLIAVLTLDLLTKELAQEFLSDRSYDLLPFLKLFLIYNRGAAFGIFADMPDLIRLPLLILTPIVAFIVTFIYSRKVSDTKLLLILGMIGGGALGNLYDRLFLGKVRDFIHIHVGDYYWPAFNVADASISVAITLLILSQLRK